jgi:hypothetical protein
MTMTGWPPLNYNVVNLPEITATQWVGMNPGAWAPTRSGVGFSETSSGVPPGWPSNVGSSDIGNYQGGPSFVPTGPAGGSLNCYGPGIAYPGVTATGRVGFADIPGNDSRAVCAWADPNNGNRITVAYRNAQGIWQEPFVLNESSSQGVDVQVDGANAWSVLLAWTGTDPEATVNFAAMPFGNKELTLMCTFWGHSAQGTPAVAVSDEYTFLAWTDASSALHLLKVQPLVFPQGIVEWQTAYADLSEFSPCPPRLNWLMGGMLGLTWLGTDGELNLLTLNPDTGQGTKYIARTSVGSTCAPTVLIVGWWYMVWVNDNSVYLTCSETMGTANGSWYKALGLGCQGTLPSVDGVGLGWNQAGDGLELGYRSLGITGEQAPNGMPCVGQMSLDPTQWAQLV